MRVRSISVGVAVVGCVYLVALAMATIALAVSAPPYISSFGPDGTESTGFGKAGPIAVDQQTHAVYVVDHANGSLYKFDLEGDPVDFGGSSAYISGNEISGLSFFAGNGEAQVAVDSSSHNVYVTSGNAIRAFEEDGEPYEFTAGPGSGTSEIGGFSELLGVAVDATGDIYAADFAGFVKIYAPSGEQITQFEASSAANLAVNSSGVVYVNRWHSSVTAFTPSVFPVTMLTSYTEAAQPLDSANSNTVGVDPTTNDVYVAHDVTDPGIAWYDETGTLLSAFAGSGEEGEVQVSEGVAIDGAERRVFVSNEPSSGLSQVETFWEEIYEGVPRVESVSATEVTSDSGNLRARINPGSFETVYRFEYGPEDCSVGACTSVPVAGAGVGAGHEGVSVSQSLTGLLPSTTYHYRVVAENEKGDNLAAESDHTFDTQSGTLGFQLSDSRVWELVSPPDKHGAVMLGNRNAYIQAAADGESIAYATRGSIELGPEGDRTPEASTILARRTSDNWTSKDITLSNDGVREIPVGNQSEYKLFSSDLLKGVVEPRTSMPHSSDATEKTPYLRENTEPAGFTPLLTPRNVPIGTEFGGDPKLSVGPVNIAAATPDLSHVVLDSEIPLAEGAPPAPGHSLYLWVGGRLKPVSLLPAGEGGGIANTDVVGSGSHQIAGGHTIENAISSDGSRIFWSSGNLAALYLRDMEANETVRLDVVQLGASGLGQSEPIFQGASADGRVVFFTDSRQLTINASLSGTDLYRCEIPLGSTAAGCSSLEDITAIPGENADVVGLASGLGDDGSTIYFVAKGKLEGEANDGGETAVSGEPNLYAWKKGKGIRYIATLSDGDQHDWGGEKANTVQLSAAASPDGRYLSFVSNRPLLGDDNLDGESGKPVQQVYRYDVSADRLDCLSCKATHASPEGELVNALEYVDPQEQWSGEWVAAVLPEPTVTERISLVSLYSSRVVHDNGRVFFNSVDALVPADVNGEWDVYQYEPVGIGSCTSSSGGAATATTAGGCVSLVSSGTGGKEAAFLDASETGDDAFFLSSARLSAIDGDSEYDVYDARVGGALANQLPQSECVGEACQVVAVVPGASTPTSSTFQGPGNVSRTKDKHCRRGTRKVRRHRKTLCVRQKRKKHGKHKGHHKPARQSGRARG